VARPARYSADELLDAAAALLAGDGPAAVTMSAVARTVGAPSGSVYHRFPTRAALCGELWIRTEERFQGGFADALASPGDTTARCVAAALFAVQWCRDHPVEAQVLLAGADALDRSAWPGSVTTRRNRLHRTLNRLLAGLDADPDRLSAALVDVPYAVVRRHLVAGQRIPETADAIVEDCARALISGG
jgi:AcrR family transcriptional regulator